MQFLRKRRRAEQMEGPQPTAFPMGQASRHVVQSMKLLAVGRLTSLFSSFLVSSEMSFEHGFSDE